MNESKKELAQYLKLNYGLHYKNKNFVPSQTVVDGELELEKYTDQILIYEPIQDNSSNNTWDLFANKYDIKNDDDSLEFEKIQDKLPLLAKKDVKLLIPVLRITYFGNVKSSIVRENYQEFLAREVLVGGFLIIRDALLDNSLEFDRLKAHISWAINEARWECKNLLKSAIMHSKVENIEDSNGNPIYDIKTLTDYLNQLYKFETPTIISYEKVQEMNNSLFNFRLIPGITNYHKEITMKCWTQDNIYLNLPFWIKEYQLNHGMVITSYGLVPGIKPALDFLSVPSIKRQRKIRLKASFIRNELLHSKIYIDELNLENLPFFTLFDTASTNDIQCNIFHGEVVINIWEKQNQISEPSQQLVEDIKRALSDINPYKSLKKVFSEYGHVICTEITMGGRLGLGASTVNEETQEEFRQYLDCIEWSEWSDIIILKCKELLKKLNMGDQKLIAYNNSETNLDELNIWLNNTSEKPNSWSLVDQPKLISLCEIFHEDIKRQIQNLLENKQKILMTGVTKLSSSKIRYYRVEFENYLLTSDDYQIIGSIIVNNERFDDLSVKFHMKSISGFSIIIKEYKELDKEIKGDLKVVWQLIGKPKSIGYFSKQTRNNEVFNTEFETEIPEQKISLQIDVKEELSPDFIIATSIQYPPTNYEYMLQVVVKSWSGKIIDLDIINFGSFDKTQDKACIQLYVINPNQQESVIADFGSEQVLWKLIGHKLGPVNWEPDIRVVVGLDFGTTYSGFAYCHVSEEGNIRSNDYWPDEIGQLKTKTVLQYDDEYNNVKFWGAPALAKKQSRRTRNQNCSEHNEPIELFKLHLSDLSDELKPKLPVCYEKAITDYLREIGKVIKKIIATTWPGVNYLENVLLVITIPAEFSETSKAIMRTCAFDAGLIKEKYSTNLQFTTEPEAAAIYCMEMNLKEQALAHPGTNFMIVDCGGGMVDVTVRKLINNDQLGEITERAGDSCGSIFIDAEFVKYLRKILGDEPMDFLKDRNYGQMQSLIQQFCENCKLPFTGDNPDFSYDLDLEDARPILLECVSDEVRTKLENNDWTIDIDFATVKSIFEPVIQRILKLIKAQLRDSQETCSAMFLVGGFSESEYLQKRIKQEFQHIVNLISVPVLPTAAISRGATMYGLSIRSNLNNIGNNKSVISSRTLKYTYGCDMWRKWEHGDPTDRKTPDGFIVKFKCLARHGTKMNIDQEVTVTRVPILENQESMVIKLYYTRKYDAEYCDDPDMKLLGKLIVNLPGSGLHRSILFGLNFGKMELIANSKNKLTSQSDITTFNSSLDKTATPNLVLNELVEQYNQSEKDYKKSGSDKPKDDIINDTRILVAIDFGTTYSSFAYVHKENPEAIIVNYSWPGKEGVPKAPTALQYDEGYKNVTGWGNLALEEDPDEALDDTEEQRPRPVELFKLHISNLSKKVLPWLPPQLRYTKAIEDYLTQMRKLIQVTLERRWPTINFPQQVGFVLTIPAEWPPHTTKVMRECAYKAGLLLSLNSQQLEFTTEPEAAALHCLSVIKEHNLQPNDSFLVADCGGGTVDLTLRKLLPGNKLSEITERVGDLCGSTFVDKEFLYWLGRKVGLQALAKWKTDNYGQMQYLVQRFFCTRIKFKFSGEKKDYRTLKLNLQQFCPSLSQYVVDEIKEQMEEAGWILKVDYETVKGMFDPVIDRIINLIDDQLKNSSEKNCSAIFLVGGFSESPYLLRKVKETFEHQVPIIAVPAVPIAAIVRGAITYGLNVDNDIVPDRVLKWTYGIEVCRPWVSGDKPNKRTKDGMYHYFHELAKRGSNVKVNQKFSGDFYPIRSNQDIITFNVYYTSKYEARYCSDPEMRLLGVIRVKTYDTHLGLNRPIEFSLAFGKVEIKATTKNKSTGEIYNETTLELTL